KISFVQMARAQVSLWKDGQYSKDDKKLGVSLDYGGVVWSDWNWWLDSDLGEQQPSYPGIQKLIPRPGANDWIKWMVDSPTTPYHFVKAALKKHKGYHIQVTEQYATFFVYDKHIIGSAWWFAFSRNKGTSNEVDPPWFNNANIFIPGNAQELIQLIKEKHPNQ